MLSSNRERWQIDMQQKKWQANSVKNRLLPTDGQFVSISRDIFIQALFLFTN